jgi:5'-nucleotidase
MTRGHWTEEWEPCPRRGDANYFWLTGHFENDEPEDITRDRSAMNQGYAAITPIKVDITDYALLEELKQWNF